MDDTEDLFGHVPQPSAPAAEHRRPLTSDDVRNQMHNILAALREAREMPFEVAELRKHRAMFPIMAQWLEPEEGQQLVFDFEFEVERLLKAA
jgi:hypothetical protein